MRVAVAALLLLAAVLAQAADAPGSVGQLIRNNGMSRNGWLRVRTPSILQVEPAPPPAPRAIAAIEHYERAAALADDPLLRAEAWRRAGDLRLEAAATSDPPQPEALDAAIANYRQALADADRYAHADRVLYQLAHALQLRGDDDGAIAALQRLGQEHPRSARADEAWFRAGELLFRARRYAQADAAYAALLGRAPGELRARAQEKHAWSLFVDARPAQAASAFIDVLEARWATGDWSDGRTLEHALAGDQRELLRALARALDEEGGVPALDRELEQRAALAFAPALYAALGDWLLERQRYTDGAAAYAAFAARYPSHALAPAFQARVMATYRRAGFSDLWARSAGEFVEDYAPGAAYWSSRTPDGAVLAQVRDSLAELGRREQARAQQLPEELPARRAGFLAAAQRYAQLLAWYPQDREYADVAMLRADALLDGGALAEAAGQYSAIARLPGAVRGEEAALAAVQVWTRLADDSTGAARAAAQREAIAAGLDYASHFGASASAAPVLARVAADQLELGERAAAIEQARRVLAVRSLTPALQSEAWGIIGDAHAAGHEYALAEAAYAAQRPLVSGDARAAVEAQLAAMIYRQAEGRRAAGDLRAAAQGFLRVAGVTPAASIRATADFDAGAALLAAHDWLAAAQVLEAFRTRFAGHPLVADADRKLVLAWQQAGRPLAAAEACQRIAARDSESAVARSEAGGLAARLFDQAADPRAAGAYEAWLATAMPPIDEALQARRRLADLARAAQAPERYRHWLDEMLRADGAGVGDAGRALLARAHLERGRLAAERARGIALLAPLAVTLRQRKLAIEVAVADLGAAVQSGYAGVATAAAFELGNVYRDLGRALLDSERPRSLHGEALQQYEQLLGEQAGPFERKAIAAHESNLQRLREGAWDEWIASSVQALAAMAPAQYGKREQREGSYESVL